MVGMKPPHSYLWTLGGQSRDSHPTVGQYLTRDQARHKYKKVETGEIINVDMVKHEIEQEKQLSQKDDDSGEVNPYRELVVNNAEKIEMQKTQMEQWSILSTLLNYVLPNESICIKCRLRMDICWTYGVCNYAFCIVF